MNRVSYPPLPSRVGKRGMLVIPPDGECLRFIIKDEITRPQSDQPGKIICLQRVQFEDRREEIRLGYYIIGKLPRMRGRWVWGQFATLLPMRDFRAIVNAAKKRGWL
ncbi:MAG: hypothetical protein WCC53_08280 [Thermoanaerobaculia bacterium]